MHPPSPNLYSSNWHWHHFTRVWPQPGKSPNIHLQYIYLESIPQVYICRLQRVSCVYPWMVFVLHNVLSSSNVVEVGQILFCHQPNFANDCNGLSYGGWLMCPPFFVSGTHFGALGGPWRVPGGSKNLPKQCILLWLPPMPQNGLNKA